MAKQNMNDQQLRQMAKTAFDVLNQMRRLGLKQDQQLDEVVKGFKVDLAEFEALTVTVHGGGGGVGDDGT